MTWRSGFIRYFILAGAFLLAVSRAEGKTLDLTLCCEPGNDLYRVIVHSGYEVRRVETAAQAVDRSPPGSAVLFLADRYPDHPIAVDAAVLDRARDRRLRVYIEYPSTIPGMEIPPQRTVEWERVVVTSPALGRGLPILSLLSVQQASFLPVQPPADSTVLLALARVAGYNRAVFGLPSEVYPLLFTQDDGKRIVATAGLSHFSRGRYEPSAAWTAVWEEIISRLQPDAPRVKLRWQPTARPAFGRTDVLPSDVERQALAAGARWYHRSGLLLTRERQSELLPLLAAGTETVPAPGKRAAADGKQGILEGYASGIQPDGSQRQRIPLRADCNAESAMALALAGTVLGRAEDRSTAANLLDYLYRSSGMTGGARGDPGSPAFGLIAWGAVAPAWEVANYGDDNARALLATMAAAATLRSHRWDIPLLRGVLANFRTTGQLGFRGDRIDMPDLERNGWRHYHDGQILNFSPHFESYLWACYLKAYAWTRYRPFLDKTLEGIRRMMAAYPQWRLAPSIERARMLLCLAWLVRVDDSPETRGWLHHIASELLADQEPCGAIRESLPRGANGEYFSAPASNAAYGTGETPLIQEEGDPASDQLYTSGFALLGLHEAAASTGDDTYLQAEDRLASFLCRIQIRSKPWLNGAWFRAFDTGAWDYWASSADTGWGAWCVETGWGQSWTLAVLALRSQHTSLWDLTSNRPSGARFADLRKQLLNDAE